MFKRIVLPVLLLTIFATLSISSAGAVEYRLIRLDLGGGISGDARAINNHNQIAGSVNYNAAIWDTPASFRSLGPNTKCASDINDNGQAVGNPDSYTSGTQGFSFDSTKGLTDLNSLLGTTESRICGINESGLITGWMVAGGTKRGFIWDPSSGLSVFDGYGRFSYAWGMNNSGQVVGQVYTDTSGYGSNVFIWDKVQGMRDLGAMGGWTANAVGINDFGQIAGYAATGSGFHGFIWDENNGRLDIGVTPGYNNSFVSAINDKGQVVGRLNSNNTGASVPFIWDKQGGICELPILQGPYDSWSASGINDAGWIVGYARDAITYQGVALLWVPVPEPGSIFVMLCGLGGFGCRLRFQLQSSPRNQEIRE